MADTPNDPFAFFTQFMKSGSAAPNPFMPPLNEEEIDRKITELKTIEQWLQMQVGMLQVTVQTLELQKAGLAAFKQGLEPKHGNNP